MTQEELIKSLNDLSKKLESKEITYCNFNINDMTICFIPKIKLLGGSLYIYSNPGEVVFCTKLYKIEYLHAFTITSPNKEIKELINYNSFNELEGGGII